MSLPADEYRDAFGAWLDGTLPNPLPDGVAAFVLVLYEGGRSFDAQIAGTAAFDTTDSAWAYDRLFSSGENLFSVRRRAVSGSWQAALRLYYDLLDEYLRTGSRREALNAAQGVAVTFAEGDIILVRPRHPPERVHAVFDYFDGPRSGIANFHGLPHAFAGKFDDDLQDWSEFYHLKPLTDEQFRLVMTYWQIWTNWLAAYKAGDVALDTHPALPNEKALHDQIAPAVEAALTVDVANSRVVWSTFHGRLPPDGELEVSWNLVSG